MMTKTNNKDNLNCLRIDEKENAIDSLEMSLSFLKKTKENKFYWKWVIIAIYNALYGFMVCALTQGNPDNVLKGSNSYLISFKDALERIQKKEYLGCFGVKPIILDQKDKKDMEILQKILRNNFEHFSPKAWIIELSGMSIIMNTGLKIIKDLCNLGIMFTFNEDQLKHIKKLSNEIKLILQNEH